VSVSSPIDRDASRRTSPISRLAWSVCNAIQLGFTLLWSAGCITLALAVYAVTRRPRLPLAMARRLWAPGLVAAAGARVEVEGRDRLDLGRPLLFAANHQSVIDIPTLFVALPIPLRFILKRELRRMPFLGWYVTAMGMVFIDRRASSEAIEALHAAARVLRAGASLVCFPEGTRSRAGVIRPFKNGAFAVAIEAQAPVVPVAILGAGAVLPADGFRVRPGTIRVRFGEPIPTAGLAAEDRTDLARRTREAIVRLQAGS